MNAKTIIVLFAIFALCTSAAVRPAPRRLKLPSWAKNALKGCAKAVINTIIDCVAAEIKKRGMGFLAKIPGLKMVGQKLVGSVFDKLVNKLKTLVGKAIDKAIGKLRRRRRTGLFKKLKKAASGAAKGIKKAASGAAKGVAKEANKAAKNIKKEAAKAVKGAAKFAKAASKVAAKGVKAMHAAAVKLDGLTGGKLSAAMVKFVCPAFAHMIDVGIAAALKMIGWPGQAPACLITAIKNGCTAAIKAAFKKYRLRRMSIVA